MHRRSLMEFIVPSGFFLLAALIFLSYYHSYVQCININKLLKSQEQEPSSSKQTTKNVVISVKKYLFFVVLVSFVSAHFLLVVSRFLVKLNLCLVSLSGEETIHTNNNIFFVVVLALFPFGFVCWTCFHFDFSFWERLFFADFFLFLVCELWICECIECAWILEWYTIFQHEDKSIK